LTAGRGSIRLKLLDTPTAARVWAALPLYSALEPWGESIHFEVPIETGRERGARLNGAPGEVFFWIGEDRVLIPYGRTPISRPGEIRLPHPCNLWAEALDDVGLLKAARPGEKVALKRIADSDGPSKGRARSR
ncbi:MAG TPA: cyclophilin-like family protein, partial [Hyphomicrobiaceae bacterium]|nr:cyclophilin-like family protein [Hyphomicrobiaceae bacterium]